MRVLALLLALPQTPSLGWGDFPVFVWRERHAGQALPEELARPFGGVILMRAEDPTWARTRGLATLVWNIAGREPLHLDADAAWTTRVEEWIRTRDESLLVRDPCLNDPRTVARLFATLDATIARHGERGPLAFILGDEVGWTPGGAPFDLCRCAHCEARWRTYARAHGQPERAPLTDEVRLALLDGDDSRLGPWLARRRFERESLFELLERLARRAEHLPAPIGVLGMTVDAPFGGLDPERCIRTLGLRPSETYPVAESRALEWTARLHAAAPWPPPSLATVFLREETPAGAAWVAWDHWLRGGTGLVLWSDAELEDRPDHARRLAQAVTTLRSLPPRGGWPYRFPGPAVAGVALVRDADSAAFSWLSDALLDGPTWPRRLPSFQAQHGSRERKVRAWRAAAEDAGLSPGALSVQAIDAARGPDGRPTFPVLLLVDLAILGDDDRSALERHLDAGGVLLVDGDLGTRDRAGRLRPASFLEPLRARASERVLVGATPGRAALEQALERAGLARELPLRLGASLARLDWLVSAQPEEIPEDRAVAGPARSSWTFALLPNLATPDERRARLADLGLEVEPPEGWSLEWIHPRAGEPPVLAAGDAAVLRIRGPQAPR